MHTPDVVNGLFEFTGGVLLWVNCYKLYVDKKVHGVSVLGSIFWASWSLWNLYYYPHLNQWASFVGALNIATPNVVWSIMAIYYSRKRREKGGHSAA